MLKSLLADTTDVVHALENDRRLSLVRVTLLVPHDTRCHLDVWQDEAWRYLPFLSPSRSG
jgi:hypothetical protein